MDNDLLKIEKLQDNEQWLLWKFQIKVILKASDLWKTIDGTYKKPILSDPNNEDVYNKVLVEWEKMDGKAQKVIVTTIGSQPMLHIICCETSNEMWSKLESVYEQKSKTSVYLLQEHYYSFSKDPDDSLSVHIGKLQKIVQQLKDLDEVISDSMVITKILMSLPSTYNHFYSAWLSTNATDQTLKNLTVRLLMEESRIEAQLLNINEDFLAKKYHKIFKSNSLTQIEPKKLGKCFVCKNIGHWKSDCPDRKKNKNKKISKQNRGTAFVGISNFIYPDDNDSWFLDSGATDHMSYRIEWFNNYKSFEIPQNIRLGNGEVILAYGTGNINILAYNNYNWEQRYLSNVLYVPDIKLNLFSSNAALDKGMILKSDNKRCELIQGNSVAAVGIRKNKLFKLMFKVIYENYHNDFKVFSAVKEGSLENWHVQRLGHQNFAQVRQILNKLNIKF